MSGLENRLMLALRSRKIKEYGFDDISSFCVLLIVQTYALLGYQNYNKTDVSLLARRLATDLYESYGYLSKEEVQICFELGAKGNFSDYAYANYRTFALWLKAYIRCDLRYTCQVLLIKATQKVLPPISEAYQQQCLTTMVQRCFDDYKKTGSMEKHLTWKVYEVLQKRQILHNTKQEKLNAYHLFDVKQKRNNLCFDDDLRRRRVVSQAQTYLLKQYFDSIDSLPVMDAA